jgi:hypothetical protein
VQSCGAADVAAKPACRKSIEAAGIRDVARHRRIARRERQQDHDRGDEQRGRARAVAEHDADRHAARERDERTGCGDHKEDDETEPQRFTPQLG